MRRAAGRLTFAGLAVTGVVLGHALVYAIAVGDGDLRHDLLAETGHGYWMTAVVAAILLGIVAAAARIRRLLLPGRGEDGDIRAGFVLRLAAAQTALFVALEVGERLTVGASVSHFFGDHLFTLGVAVQMATALGVALLLRLLGTTALAVAAALTRRLAPPAAANPPRRARPGFRPLPLVLAGAAGARAPPSA